ncbi:hypothetical protein BJ322DRAFT_1057823 [Thelephora terrestris]|uniref:Secreted protein n=1 Tax=Thelephora terrestris TaxID=56493 RepID=A0A9P6HFD5_9AGAM|nr:hypothetical protein BJ322DRAFT_1057823 [Thelephora terrestris]
MLALWPIWAIILSKSMLPPMPGMPGPNSGPAPSCSSSSTHLSKSVLMKSDFCSAFERRGQYSSFFSFFRKIKAKRRAFRVFLYPWR